MQKIMIPFLLVAGMLFCQDLMAQKKKTVTRRTRVNRVVVKEPEPEKIDTVETKIEVKQGSYKAQLLGRWNIASMARQQKEGPQQLEKGLYIIFKEDDTFNGFAGCNTFSGTYNATGASLLLGEIATTKIACDKMGMEAVVLKHLAATVKAFSSNSPRAIALMDGTGNIVFECTRD